MNYTNSAYLTIRAGGEWVLSDLESHTPEAGSLLHHVQGWWSQVKYLNF